MGETGKRLIIVAVDGPAGSGKSSICAGACRALGWSYVNTGALYRAVGLIAQDRGIDLNNEKAVGTLLERIAPEMRWDHATGRLFVGETDITPRLGSVEAGNGASFIAKQPLVRSLLLPLQRDLVRQARSGGGVLVDGRDIGTVVFPDATLKIFMTASLEERARRRLEQLGGAGRSSGSSTSVETPTLEHVMREIEKRDMQDAQRDAAPMKKSPDAITFDTSGLKLDAGVAKFIALLREHIPE